MARERGKPFPPLKDSHVEFRREPWAGRGVEEFADIATVYRRGWGDCDDLTAIRVAEEHEKGRKADFRIYWRMRCPSCKRYLKTDHCPECGEKAKAKLFHAQVRLDGPKGPIEDISRLLGM